MINPINIQQFDLGRLRGSRSPPRSRPTLGTRSQLSVDLRAFQGHAGSTGWRVVGYDDDLDHTIAKGADHH